MVIILQKILTLLDFLFFEKFLIVPVVIWAISFTKNLVVFNLSTFATWALKVQKFCGPYFLKIVVLVLIWVVLIKSYCVYVMNGSRAFEEKSRKN